MNTYEIRTTEGEPVMGEFPSIEAARKAIAAMEDYTSSELVIYRVDA